MIIQFYNPEMQGYTVHADFKKSSNVKKTKFSKLWEEAGYNCSIAFTVKNIDDWSFNNNNIAKVGDCGVNVYYIDDQKRKKLEQLPDELYKELKKVK